MENPSSLNLNQPSSIRKSHRSHKNHKSLQEKQIMKSRTQESVNFSKQIRAFGVLAILFEIVMCVLYGIFLDNLESSVNTVDLLLPASMALLVVVGIALMNTYLLAVDLSAMGFVILFFSMSVQLALIMRIVWTVIGIPNNYEFLNFGTLLSNNRFSTVELVNSYNDRQSSHILLSNSIVDAMATAFAIIIAMKTVMGRVGPLQLFFLTIFGTILSELNHQIFWRLFITDCGYGMRTFLFGGVLGITSSIILWKRQTTIDNDNYCTNYFSQTYAFLGSIFVWVFFPCLIITDIYHINVLTPSFDNIIIGPAVLNTIFALVSTVIGAYAASILLNRRLSINQIVFSIFTGGIVYSSSSDLLFNPALPIGVGTFSGFLTVTLHHTFKQRLNNMGILDTYGTTVTYMIPGVFASIVSAVVHATNPFEIAYTDGVNTLIYSVNREATRSNWGQGGFQIIGLAISSGIALGCGILVGIFYRFLNNNKAHHQFLDESFYQQIQKQQ